MAKTNRDDIASDLLKQHAALQTAFTNDPRFNIEAYAFVCEAVDFTCRKLDQRTDIQGHELLDGIIELALEQFGFLAHLVFQHWGITTTDDFGDMVFTLVEAGLLGRSPRDSKADFANVFDLHQALDERYTITDEPSSVYDAYLHPHQPHQETAE